MTTLRHLVVVGALLAGSPARADAPDAKAIDAAVRQAMKAWGVPGCAVVIVRDGRVVYLRGHGVREAGKKAAVTADTVFPLASCSKAFTAAALAALVDEGKVGWDDLVRKHLPWFHLSDPLADRDVRLRDLLCHRTGLASHDLLWYRAPWSAEETVRRACKLPLAKPFRTAVQYQTTMYTAAGLAAGAAAKSTWADVVQKRLLAPLGMKHTYLTTPAAEKSGMLAAGHRLNAGGEALVVPGYRLTEPEPAGSVHSTASDMARWLQLHLDRGMAAGKRVISAEALGETHAPQMVMRLPALERALFPDTVQLSYGMGWVVHDHRGIKLLSHGGAIDGFRAQVTLATGRRLGIAVLANLDQTPMNMALCSTLVDLLLELPRRDWHKIHRGVLARRAERAADRLRQRLASRRHDTTPSLPLASYAGTYTHPAYGEAKVQLRRGELVWRWRDDEVILEHFHHDTFRARAELAGDSDVVFKLDRAGKVESVHVTGRLNVTFTRPAGRKKP